MTDAPKKLRGFAAIKARDPDYQREIAARGGAGVPGKKRSFAQDHSLASEAGRKGGSHPKKTPS
jgi:hypothetical protein